MSEDKKEIIHKTEFLDKELPRIYYEKQVHQEFNKIKSVSISVSDKSSEQALETFKKVLKETKVRV